jgi:hypothetical protein
VERIISYELGSEESTTLSANKINLFTASADAMLSRMGKVDSLKSLMVAGIIVCVDV